MEKLVQVGSQPLVIGLSGSSGRGDRARAALGEAGFRTTTFEKKERVQTMIENTLRPIYEGIQRDSKPPNKGYNEIALTGLAGFWAGGQAHILECEHNADSCFHQAFHAIGSGGATAYAVYRTLGGPRLASLDEDRALVALLRIIRTSIWVDVMGVAEPITAYSITEAGTRKIAAAEIEANVELVARWEDEEQRRFFEQEI